MPAFPNQRTCSGVTGMILAAVVAMLLSGCLVHRTVSSGGQTTSSSYAFKRPLKEAVDNSQ